MWVCHGVHIDSSYIDDSYCIDERRGCEFHLKRSRPLSHCPVSIILDTSSRTHNVDAADRSHQPSKALIILIDWTSVLQCFFDTYGCPLRVVQFNCRSTPFGDNQGIVGCAPIPTYPVMGKSLNKPYSSWVFMGKLLSPRIPREPNCFFEIPSLKLTVRP